MFVKIFNRNRNKDDHTFYTRINQKLSALVTFFILFATSFAFAYCKAVL